VGPIYAAVAGVYIDEILAIGQHTHGRRRGRPAQESQVHELEMRLGTLMGAMASLAAYSPLIGACHMNFTFTRLQQMH
jgi:hypothetical protein